MNGFPGRAPGSLFLLLALLGVAAVGCSDDETITAPLEIPDPLSGIRQINALPAARPSPSEGKEAPDASIPMKRESGRGTTTSPPSSPPPYRSSKA